MLSVTHATKNVLIRRTIRRIVATIRRIVAVSDLQLYGNYTVQLYGNYTPYTPYSYRIVQLGGHLV